MLNEKFIGVITSVTAGIKHIKADDGTKMKIGTYKVKLESASVDYDSIAKFNPNVSATLLNIQPIPFVGVDFGDQSILNMAVDFFSEEEDDLQDKTTDDEINNNSDASFGNVRMINLSAKVRENIPIFVFVLEISMSYDSKFLFRHLKSKISFKFAEMKLIEGER